jgi:hypothetical protein
MEEYGRTTGDTIRGLGVFVKTLSDIPGIGLIGRAFYETSALGALARLGKENRPARELPVNEQRSSSRIYVQQLKQERRVADQLAKARAEELRLLGIKNGIENKNVKELEKKFDLERIGITQALNVATDDETKLRLKAQLAILDNNEALAKKLLAEMEAAEALKKLAEAVNKATDSLVTAFDLLSKAVKDLIISFGVSPSQVGPGGTITATAGGGPIGNLADVAINNPYFGYSDAARQLGLDLGFTPAMSRAPSPEIRVTVDTSATGDRLSQAIAESIQIATKTGYSTVPAGQGF